jgi:hypothetical protein
MTKHHRHLPIATCGRIHEGPHGLMLNAPTGASRSPETRLAALARTALLHADLDVLVDTEAIAEAVLDRADATTDILIEVTDEELEAISIAVGSGAEYMAINRYADDHGFPEDAYAASVLTPTGAPVNVCWKGLLK